MVHYNHILKHKHVGMKPMQTWYQSHGSEPKEKPIYRHDQGLHTWRYLLRKTPRRLLQWNSRKKTLSPKGKEMLMKEVEENKAYNTSRVSAKPKDHGKKIASSQKEKGPDVIFVKKEYMCFGHMKTGRILPWKCKDVVISNVQYTPEVSLNILSMDQLEEQEKTWYEVKPKKEVVKGSGTASVKDPQGKSKELQTFTSNVIGGTKLRWRLRMERKETLVVYKET
nr:hypothetical protein [Tanacetum cinerariifolium]